MSDICKCLYKKTVPYFSIILSFCFLPLLKLLLWRMTQSEKETRGQMDFGALDYSNDKEEGQAETTHNYP